MEIKVVKEFSNSPGGRTKEQSEFSGEEFREQMLLPKIREAQKLKETLLIDLDGTYGYSVCFIDEVFGGLVRVNKLSLRELKDVLRFKSDDEPYLIEEIKLKIDQTYWSENPIDLYDFADYWISRGKKIEVFKDKPDDKYLSIRVQSNKFFKSFGCNCNDCCPKESLTSFHRALLKKMPENNW